MVVDAGSTDRTLEAAQAFPFVRVCRSRKGRAMQMNEGARHAQGGILWFLHADSVVHPKSAGAIRQALETREVAGGAFRFTVDGSRPFYRLIERVVEWRSRWAGLPYGDQGLFLRREMFDRIGGFPEWPILEDIALARRLGRLGQVVTLPLPLLTSARRWEREGVVRTTIRHLLILGGYAAGVAPAQLARWENARSHPHGDAQTIQEVWE
jgi:rSAM/selenodomain-associated transferase 2